MDKVTRAERSALMSRVRSKGSKPEMAVRSIVHGMGFRYRLHATNLPGTPDLVFVARKKIVLVHGCFWHGHHCRSGRNRPATHTEYWNATLERNMKRDRANAARLRRLGWQVLSVWECQVRETELLAHRLRSFLENH
jgi:DNA mismatch endonuclease, patch repair protein